MYLAYRRRPRPNWGIRGELPARDGADAPSAGVVTPVTSCVPASRAAVVTLEGDTWDALGAWSASRRWIRRTEEASGSETSDDTPQARLLFRLGDQLPRFESRYE